MFLIRLAFDLIAAALLLIGLAYWWLGNTVHEVAGTGMFLLVIVHNVFNRRWYGRIPNSRSEARGVFNVGITLVLLVAMLALLVTSVLISNTLSGFMSAYGGFTVRQIHTLAAYWVLVIVSIHLGLRWPTIMGVARTLLGISRASAVRTTALRAAAVVIAIHGVWSSFELGLGTKLAMQVTLDWWNFEESVAGFFVHCIAIAGLYMALTYYVAKCLQRRKRWTSSLERVAAVPRGPDERPLIRSCEVNRIPTVRRGTTVSTSSGKAQMGIFALPSASMAVSLFLVSICAAAKE
jgi:hypothetical protein